MFETYRCDQWENKRCRYIFEMGCCRAKRAFGTQGNQQIIHGGPLTLQRSRLFCSHSVHQRCFKNMIFNTLLIKQLCLFLDQTSKHGPQDNPQKSYFLDFEIEENCKKFEINTVTNGKMKKVQIHVSSKCLVQLKRSEHLGLRLTRTEISRALELVLFNGIWPAEIRYSSLKMASKSSEPH